MNTSTLAGPLQLHSTKTFADIAAFITGLIGYPIICFVGILGNGICIFVFNRQKMRNSTNAYLTALAVSDIVKLLNDFMYFPTVLLDSQVLYAIYYPYGFFISQYFAMVSAWLTVSVAFERLLMVVYPGCSRGLLTVTKAKLESFLVYLILFCVNIPCGLRYRTVCKLINTNVTATCTGNSSVESLDVETTELWHNKNFRQIYTLIQGSMRSIIPVVILIGLNVRIIISLHQTRANKRMNARNRVTFLLIIVVGCFICLAAPDAVMSLMGWGYHDAGSNLRKGLREITDMLLALNSAVNFFLYVVFNSVFRENLLTVCKCCFFYLKCLPVNLKTPSPIHQVNGHSPETKHHPEMGDDYTDTTIRTGGTNIRSVSQPSASKQVNIYVGMESTLQPLLLKAVSVVGSNVEDDLDTNSNHQHYPEAMTSFIVHNPEERKQSCVSSSSKSIDLQISSVSLLPAGVLVTDIV